MMLMVVMGGLGSIAGTFLGAVVITDKRIEGPEHKKFVAAEIDKWGAVIKAAGTYAD